MVEKALLKLSMVFLLKFKRVDIFALLGLNGAGKTTTIRCILGLCKKDSGDITYNGKYKIAYVPEGKDLYGSYKVKKMIEITKV